MQAPHRRQGRRVRLPNREVAGSSKDARRRTGMLPRYHSKMTGESDPTRCLVHRTFLDLTVVPSGARRSNPEAILSGAGPQKNVSSHSAHRQLAYATHTGRATREGALSKGALLGQGQPGGIASEREQAQSRKATLVLSGGRHLASAEPRLPARRKGAVFGTLALSERSVRRASTASGLPWFHVCKERY